MDEGTKFILKMVGASKQLNRVGEGKCPTCNKKIIASEFKDPLSFKEFTISGMCQFCQNEVFKKEE